MMTWQVYLCTRYLLYYQVSAIRGFVFFSPNPSWVSDSTNNPASATYNYTVRVCISSGIAGVVARFSTSYSGETYGQPSSVSYYAVLLDADATDLSTGSAAVSLVKYSGSSLTTLSSITASTAATFGLTLARGRWYTVTAVTSSTGIQVRHFWELMLPMPSSTVVAPHASNPRSL